MRVHPVRRYPRPRFPTRAILTAHPELLRLVPQRWRRNPVVLAGRALAGGVITRRWSGRHGALAAHGAPVFQHGDGRGAFGCIAVNPPVFLTEAEAQQVVAEEAVKAGVLFGPDVHSLWEVARPGTSTQPPPNAPSRPASGLTPLVLDGVDRQRQVGYEFVSISDFTAWDSRAPGKYWILSAGICDMRGEAEALRKEIHRAAPAGAFAVFYDPAVGREDGGAAATGEPERPRDNADRQRLREHKETTAKEVAREELRRQVRDFVQWLKGEGVI